MSPYPIPYSFDTDAPLTAKTVDNLWLRLVHWNSPLWRRVHTSYDPETPGVVCVTFNMGPPERFGLSVGPDLLAAYRADFLSRVRGLAPIGWAPVQDPEPPIKLSDPEVVVTVRYRPWMTPAHRLRLAATFCDLLATGMSLDSMRDKLRDVYRIGADRPWITVRSVYAADRVGDGEIRVTDVRPGALEAVVRYAPPSRSFYVSGGPGSVMSDDGYFGAPILDAIFLADLGSGVQADLGAGSP